jgi:hypothetical protein
MPAHCPITSSYAQDPRAAGLQTAEKPQRTDLSKKIGTQLE